MNRTNNKLLPFLMLSLAALALVSCGEAEGEEKFETEEGVILELGELEYRVQLTRFLNRNDPEDAAYLKGVPPAPEGHEYLAVFIRVKNRSEEETIAIPRTFKVRDTREKVFFPVETESEFALELGAEIPPEEEIPASDTPAANGPVKGSMILFDLPLTSSELRPLELEFFGPEGQLAHVELDL